MKKLRGFLLGVAMVLPLTVLGASVDLSSTSYVDTSRPEAQYDYHCCWVFFMGMWWCVPCDV